MTIGPEWKDLIPNRDRTFYLSSIWKSNITSSVFWGQRLGSKENRKELVNHLSHYLKELLGMFINNFKAVDKVQIFHSLFLSFTFISISNTMSSIRKEILVTLCRNRPPISGSICTNGHTLISTLNVSLSGHFYEQIQMRKRNQNFLVCKCIQSNQHRYIEVQVFPSALSKHYKFVGQYYWLEYELSTLDFWLIYLNTGAFSLPVWRGCNLAVFNSNEKGDAMPALVLL